MKQYKANFIIIMQVIFRCFQTLCWCFSIKTTANNLPYECWTICLLTFDIISENMRIYIYIIYFWCIFLLNQFVIKYNFKYLLFWFSRHRYLLIYLQIPLIGLLFWYLHGRVLKAMQVHAHCTFLYLRPVRKNTV